MKQRLNHYRTVFIHDFDGVHYDYAAFPDITDFLVDVKSRAVSKLMPFLASDEIRTMGRESYAKTGDGLRLFVDAGEANGMDRAELCQALHIAYHQIAYQSILEHQAHLFAPCLETNRGFDALKGHVRHGMLTQSCLDNWAKPLATLQQRLQYFEPDALLGFAECGFESKSASIRPLQLAMEKLNARPHEVVFLEDHLGNLEKAKELDERIMTVFVAHGKTLPDLPQYVDMQISTVEKFLLKACDVFTAPQIRYESSERYFHV